MYGIDPIPKYVDVDAFVNRTRREIDYVTNQT